MTCAADVFTDLADPKARALAAWLTTAASWTVIRRPQSRDRGPLAAAFRSERGRLTATEVGVVRERHRLTGPVSFPNGAWPRRMCAAHAAAYCGELTVEAFLNRVGSDYPPPRVIEGRRRLWLKDDLDDSILLTELDRAVDIAEDL